MENKWGIIIGVVGIILAWYFYESGKETQSISYDTEFPIYKLFDGSVNSSSSSLSLYYDDSIRINSDVYLYTMSLWNSGDNLVSKKDIRKNMVINFNGAQEVLECKILKEITQGTSNFRLLRLSSNSFQVDWDYFDPMDGIKIQIIFTEVEHPVPISVEGRIIKTPILKYYKVLTQELVERIFHIVLYLAILILGYRTVTKIILSTAKDLRLDLFTFNKKNLVKDVLFALIFIGSIAWMIIMLIYNFYKLYLGLSPNPFS